ncbi:hypothetical protein [Streptomyces chrestomyceticus]|uniref:hypothetical protein n=1 Tax=Streptomyces chrestomyceticus TaxID=68185 RepID=UPI0033E160B5
MSVVQMHPAVRHATTTDERKTPIIALLQRVTAIDLPSRQREHGEAAAFQAVLAANAVLTGSFLDTLGAAVPPMSWTGYPPVDDAVYAACAVAYLGSADGTRGWWLHATQRHDQLGEAQHVLALIAPCTCGTYLHVEIPDEDALIVMLDELDTAPGAPVACDYRLRIRSASYADPAHDDFEPPF